MSIQPSVLGEPCGFSGLMFTVEIESWVVSEPCGWCVRVIIWCGTLPRRPEPDLQRERLQNGPPSRGGLPAGW